MSETFSLVIAEDHAVLRAGIEAYLRENAADLRIVASLASGAAAVEFCRVHPPDAILLDLSHPGLSGVELIESLHQAAPNSQIVVLSMHGDEATVLGALQAGARGYVRKSNSMDNVLESIRSVLRGASYLDPEASRLVLERMRTGGTAEPARVNLTPRELDILRLLANGHPSSEIAALLALPLQTVRSHRTAIRRKLGVQNTAGATRVAMELGLLQPRAAGASAGQG